MQITRQADYALRAVIFLARMNGDERASTSAIAENQKIPPSFLAKIVSQLSLAGLIQTSRGARGGVSLAKKPEEISVLDVIEAIDGPVLLNECAGNPENCPFGLNCPLQHIWCDTRKELISRLSSATFARENVQ
ncbi:MAG: Rrf2 family transcriptional regulator [Anaerolineae bacterium]|jgi:Rrf2 family protein|nr:Rrf2 family transcriptional regulator [Anaerolineae bacterium]